LIPSSDNLDFNHSWRFDNIMIDELDKYQKVKKIKEQVEQPNISNIKGNKNI
jgi:hypothetical protein